MRGQFLLRTRAACGHRRGVGQTRKRRSGGPAEPGARKNRARPLGACVPEWGAAASGVPRGADDDRACSIRWQREDERHTRPYGGHELRSSARGLGWCSRGPVPWRRPMTNPSWFGHSDNEMCLVSQSPLKLAFTKSEPRPRSTQDRIRVMPDGSNERDQRVRPVLLRMHDHRGHAAVVRLYFDHQLHHGRGTSRLASAVDGVTSHVGDDRFRAGR